MTSTATQLEGGGTIQGVVVGPDGLPEAGVYVYLGLPIGTTSPVYQPGNAAYVNNNSTFDFTSVASESDQPFTVTGADGRYEFDNLIDTPPANLYTVSELVPANQVVSHPTGDYIAVSPLFTTTSGFTYTNNYVYEGSHTDTVNGTPDIVPTFVNEEAGPADPVGAVGPNDIIQADNNNFIVYNKISGTIETSMSLDQFWLAAWAAEARGAGVDGSDVLMNAYEPQVVYDSASGRWYVSALDNSNPPYTPFLGTSPGLAANDILLAVSKDSNPADGWVQFVLPADSFLYGLNPDPLTIDPTGPRTPPAPGRRRLAGLQRGPQFDGRRADGQPVRRRQRGCDRRRPGLDRLYLDSERGSPFGHDDGRCDRHEQLHQRERRSVYLRNQSAVRREL